MRVLGWLLLVCVGFPLVGGLVWIAASFALGFWTGTMEAFGVALTLSPIWSSLVVLLAWALLIRWYYRRGRLAS